MKLNWLRVEQWNRYPDLLHGFLGRQGGKSVGPYAELNVSYRVGDDNKIVSQNVCDMKQAVGIHDGRIITMKQVHGDHIVEVKDTKIKEAGEADGMVTREKCANLGVLYEDCLPILLMETNHIMMAEVNS